MRIFIIPSWCPTVDQPVSGAFFVEQAHAIAQLRPNWTIALCLFDLARSRVPWRPNRIPEFVKDWLNTPRMMHEQAKSGLHEYKVWSPYVPHFGSNSKLSANANALSRQVKVALDDFIQRFGKPDLIHAHAVYPGGAAAVALGRAYKIPVGLTEHLGPFPPPTLCRHDGHVIPLVADTYAEVSLCSAVSQSLADRIIGLGLAEKVTVLPNFLSDKFGSLHNKLPTPHDGFSFLSVGGPSHAKGTDMLLKALAQVSPDITLSIVGESPELAFFQQMSTDLGLTQRVQWFGSVPRDQISSHYQTCDALVSPSHSETFGITLIEALAFGKPIIATRCGGPEDIVRPSNGLLVAINSVDDLVVGMLHMVTHANHYPPEVLQSDFLARFSASAALTRIEPWYRAVMNHV